ncbi:MAG TPA: DNA repair protein RecO [Rhizomicrobium sp.]|jgi:DNA repair protein RecO (recombination protein O)
MEWAEDAIVLSARRHGESNIVLEGLTRSHGRHLGLVHGGSSRRYRSAVLPGNTLHVMWRARLPEHLGTFAIELRRERAGAILEKRDALVGLSSFAEISRVVLPEREPHPGLYEAAEILLDAIATDDYALWAPLYVRWELGVLEALGFGLDLSRCAATGQTDDLRYVSPRSGRAVSCAAGEPYRDRLFEIPAFLVQPREASASHSEIRAGLGLTAHFLLQRVLLPHHRPIPDARARLDVLAARESA